MKKLRAEDPSLWSVATLARLFNVKRIVIRLRMCCNVNVVAHQYYFIIVRLLLLIKRGKKNL